MYEDELNRILEASQKNVLSFFVGAGVSALSGVPNWKGLIDAICEELGRTPQEKYSSDECLQIPQMFYYSLGEDKAKYYEFVESKLCNKTVSPNRVHREMLLLNPVSFITTNYDTLLEDAAIDYCHSYKLISQDKDVPSIFGDKYILKLHGDFVNKNFVLKEEDYLNYSENFKLIETLMKSIFSTNTVVFIGYGLNDYNIKLILNWTKSLLKGNFRKPIFIYTDNNPLSKEERIYQESKGISVIEWNKLISSTDDFLERYLSVFDSLKNQQRLSLDKKTKFEAFDVLFKLLAPLNCLNALRICDVSKSLESYVVIDLNGVIHYRGHNSNILFQRFLAINQMTEPQQMELSKIEMEKYRCILSVFIKARILVVEDGKNRILIVNDNELPFADRNCILFDYNAMYAFSSKSYKSIEYNYKKAYYLSRLNRFDEAFYLFSDVAQKAFCNKDYLTFYFAKTNCINLRKIIDNVNARYNCYDMESIKDLSPNDAEIENLYRSLPIEFRNTYKSLKDVHDVSLLYKYSYDAFADGQKLQKCIESGTTEFGFTSSGKAVCRINDYLHFLHGNGIIADLFSEYKVTVKNLMSLLVYKYTTQGKKVLHTQPFPNINSNEVYFDEIDFYYFIDCFNAEDIISLFKKYNIDTIEFHNMNLIEDSVKNLMNYYDYSIKYSKNNIDVISLQLQIKTCLVLLQYVRISQELVDRICEFILTKRFIEIFIDDKIRFLDYQLIHRKMFSDNTKRIIESTLVSYMDQHITALEKNTEFNLFSKHSDVNYYNLVHYIVPQGEVFCSQKLSLRVSKIINGNLTQMIPQVIQYYYEYISKYQKKKIITWVNKAISENFSFDLFKMLVYSESRISKIAKSQLKEYLRQIVNAAQQKNDNKTIVAYPIKQPYEELNQVGFWCFINVLKAKDFKEFLGYSAKFDFYCEYSKFDFKRFDVSWLLPLYSQTLAQIAKNEIVRENIRKAIASTLSDNSIVDTDYQRLNDILVHYFC